MTTMQAITVIDGVSLKGRIRRGVPPIFVDGLPCYGRRLLHKPWAHNPDCACEVHETFTCDQCGRRVGYCMGAHDNMPGACDFCWRPQ